MPRLQWKAGWPYPLPCALCATAIAGPFDQFKGKTLSQIVLVKGDTKENIQAVSGATYSSRGVTKGVKEAAQVLIDKYGAGIKSAMQEVTK